MTPRNRDVRFCDAKMIRQRQDDTFVSLAVDGLVSHEDGELPLRVGLDQWAFAASELNVNDDLQRIGH